MPGNKENFIATSKTKPKQFEDLLNNKVMSSYRRNKIASYNFKITNKEQKEEIQMLEINKSITNLLEDLEQTKNKVTEQKDES